MSARVLPAVLLAACAFACDGAVPAKEVGAQLFHDARLGRDANTFSCGTCHAMGDAGERLLPGFDLQGAASRPTFWGGYAASLFHATNACLTIFMRAPPLTKDDAAGRALYEYLLSEGGTSPSPPLPLTIIENVTTVPRGDPRRGAQVWDAACRSCHGDPHTGAGRITALASRVPEDSADFAAQSGFPLDLVVVEKVRHGAFFGIGGNMPPFAAEQLTDEDLGALLSFLGL